LRQQVHVEVGLGFESSASRARVGGALGKRERVPR
jgi:hypothetical protein